MSSQPRPLHPVTPEQLAAWKRLCSRLLRRVEDTPPPTPVTDAHLVAVLGREPVVLPVDDLPRRMFLGLAGVVARMGELGGAESWE